MECKIQIIQPTSKKKNTLMSSASGSSASSDESLSSGLSSGESDQSSEESGQNSGGSGESSGDSGQSSGGSGESSGDSGQSSGGSGESSGDSGQSSGDSGESSGGSGESSGQSGESSEESGLSSEESGLSSEESEESSGESSLSSEESEESSGESEESSQDSELSSQSGGSESESESESESSEENSSSSSSGQVMIEGPDTLVSTTDSAGLWVSYAAVGLPPGGTYNWTVEAATPCIELQAPTSGQSVNVRAMANHSSQSIGDQTLKCTYTISGQQTILKIKITVARPAFAKVSNGGKTSISASRLTRVLKYQIVDQFSRNLKEIYSYTNAAGSNLNVRVVNLLVSEQLTVVTKVPSSAPDPTPAENVGISDTGTFSDTHSLPRNVELQVNQIIQVHIEQWEYNNKGFGNPVRYLIIKEGDPDPEKIRVYENNNGQPGQEIPEEP